MNADVRNLEITWCQMILEWRHFITTFVYVPVDNTVITWYTSSWCAQRSPHIAVKTNTILKSV